MNSPLPAGSTIGILGGGQLGRMLSLAASRLGLLTHVFDPSTGSPASQVSQQVTNASYDDADALRKFGHSVDVVTYEFENIPTAALDILEGINTIYPDRKALFVSQDRFSEKTFLNDIGLQTAPFVNVENSKEASDAIALIGTPSILKTRRMGYDGKGQSKVKDAAEILTAWGSMCGAPSILEGFIDFTKEISVIAARGPDGEVSCYDPGENVHRNGILHTTQVPATITASQRMDAILIAAKILNSLEYVGVMGVELFDTSKGFLVNEFAPRVHNSGHWTQNGCDICQFEQHIRAISGWPLGDGSRHSDVIMENLIGTDINRVPELSKSNTALHIYGKVDTRPGRKMGHFNTRT